MGSDVGQIFSDRELTSGSLDLDALVCEKDFCDSELTQGSLDLVYVGM